MRDGAGGRFIAIRSDQMQTIIHPRACSGLGYSLEWPCWYPTWPENVPYQVTAPLSDCIPLGFIYT